MPTPVKTYRSKLVDLQRDLLGDSAHVSWYTLPRFKKEILSDLAGRHLQTSSWETADGRTWLRGLVADAIAKENSAKGLRANAPVFQPAAPAAAAPEQTLPNLKKGLTDPWNGGKRTRRVRRKMRRSRRN